MSDIKRGMHPEERVLLVEKEIAESGVSEDNQKMLSLMNSIMSQYSLDMTLSVEKKLEKMEENIQPIFDEMMKDHIAIVNKALNNFLKRIQSEEVTEAKLKAYVGELKDAIDSQSTEDARALSKGDITDIYNKIVPPLKAYMDEESVQNVKNLEVLRDGLVAQAKGIGGVVQDLVRLNANKIDGLNKKLKEVEVKVAASNSGRMR